MANINICFPSDPMSPRKVDPEYFLDAQAFSKLGAGILVWPMDEPSARVKPAQGFDSLDNDTAPVAWRGWMLDSHEYEAWTAALGARAPRFTLAQYEMHHRMRNWVPAVAAFTPTTWFIESAHDADVTMFPCHVKDGVKSANATHLPRPCMSVLDIGLHETELKRQRGKLDDGLVLREHLDAWENETRVWVMGADAHDFYFYDTGQHTYDLSASWLKKALVNAPPDFFDAPFTMDIAQTKKGVLFVMDMGDAGVSDYKEAHQDPEFLDSLRNGWYQALCKRSMQYDASNESPSP